MQYYSKAQYQALIDSLVDLEGNSKKNSLVDLEGNSKKMCYSAITPLDFIARGTIPVHDIITALQLNQLPIERNTHNAARIHDYTQADYWALIDSLVGLAETFRGVTDLDSDKIIEVLQRHLLPIQPTQLEHTDSNASALLAYSVIMYNKLYTDVEDAPLTTKTAERFLTIYNFLHPMDQRNHQSSNSTATTQQ